MRYKEFGNTGIHISALGFGAMRLPGIKVEGGWAIDEDKSIAIMHRAFDLGVNYVDTAYVYWDRKSEIVVGKALKGRRDKVYLSTKLPITLIGQKQDYRRYLEEQLAKLDTDYIDFYHFHGLNTDYWEHIVLKHDLLDAAVRAKEEGLIRHISFSFHDKPEVMKTFIDTGVFESVLCQYNMIDQANADAMAYARRKGLGVAVMGPVGGGRLASPSSYIAELSGNKYKSSAELALRLVFENPDVDCALSGMFSMEMVEENAAAASAEGRLDRAEWERINAAMEETKRLADLYCTGCRYCMPCPKDIRIADAFLLMNLHRIFKLTDYARGEYRNFGTSEWYGAALTDCADCGLCEQKCPQKIEIRRQLKEVIAELG